MKKPIIGIVPLIDIERESYWMLPNYMEGVKQAGGIPIMLPLTDDLDEMKQLVTVCEGFLFTGGQDVSPELYGEKRLPQCGTCSLERDRMEKQLLTEAVLADKAILGICRGIQWINVALGGSLYQDLPTQKPSILNHQQLPPYDIPVHQVSIEKTAPLYDVLKKDILQVNSYHHQGIKVLAESLEVMATATDGLIEAVYMPDKKFVWAVQWHPEFSFKVDENSSHIFKAFINAAIL